MQSYLQILICYKTCYLMSVR